ncbi:5-oxoprolinase subunit B family protein [Anaerotruncus rubiinfantis]|uniref:5-oxoprolinase subunit B family protein n=1 Tax=Anaerotruncus rubiinfantis TaxID=1720200 RepID=UPI0011C7BC28|nr:allophanate hydrolase subunit 1 [Anaerotruncus rubiinfantis]
MAVRFLDLADTGLLVEFGNEISISINQQVNTMMKLLRSPPIEGIVELVPTYRSLMIRYKPEQIRRDVLVEMCKIQLARLKEQPKIGKVRARVIDIPILFGGEFGSDLSYVAKYHKMSEPELIDEITSHQGRVYMIGYLPGLAYIGTENKLTIPRRATPKLSMEGGSFLLQSNQISILDQTGPTGWWSVGHTPLKQFDVNRESPFLFEMGDLVNPISISREEYEQVKAQVAAGTYQVRIHEQEVNQQWEF